MQRVKILDYSDPPMSGILFKWIFYKSCIWFYLRYLTFSHLYLFKHMQQIVLGDICTNRGINRSHFRQLWHRTTWESCVLRGRTWKWAWLPKCILGLLSAWFRWAGWDMVNRVMSLYFPFIPVCSANGLMGGTGSPLTCNSWIQVKKHT